MKFKDKVSFSFLLLISLILLILITSFFNVNFAFFASSLSSEYKKYSPTPQPPNRPPPLDENTFTLTIKVITDLPLRGDYIQTLRNDFITLRIKEESTRNIISEPILKNDTAYSIKLLRGVYLISFTLKVYVYSSQSISNTLKSSLEIFKINSTEYKIYLDRDLLLNIYIKHYNTVINIVDFFDYNTNYLLELELGELLLTTINYNNELRYLLNNFSPFISLLFLNKIATAYTKIIIPFSNYLLSSYTLYINDKKTIDVRSISEVYSSILFLSYKEEENV